MSHEESISFSTFACSAASSCKIKPLSVFFFFRVNTRMHFSLIPFTLSTVPPMIWIQNQLVGVQEGQQMTLECNSEAFPKSINYWTRENNQIITNGNIS